MQNNGIWKKMCWCLVDRLLSFNSQGLCHNLPVGMQSQTSGRQLVQNLRAVLLQGGSGRYGEGGGDPALPPASTSTSSSSASFCITCLWGQVNCPSEKLNYITPNLKICCQHSELVLASFQYSIWRLCIKLRDMQTCWTCLQEGHTSLLWSLGPPIISIQLPSCHMQYFTGIEKFIQSSHWLLKCTYWKKLRVQDSSFAKMKLQWISAATPCERGEMILWVNISKVHNYWANQTLRLRGAKSIVLFACLFILGLEIHSLIS